MPMHLHRNLDLLKKQVLAVGSLVEEALAKAVRALGERQEDLAREVVQGDQLVDEREIHVEEECLKILALHQPVANDLRYVVAMMKVNNDLERMGDLAGNLAERAIDLAGKEPLAIPPAIEEMASLARAMLRECLNAVVDRDEGTAQGVLDKDGKVDELHIGLFGTLQEKMLEDPGRIADYVQLLSVSRYLERTADLATNIAEDVIFMVRGEVIRHRGH